MRAARARVRAALGMDLAQGQTLSDCAVPDRDRLHILRVSGPGMRPDHGGSSPNLYFLKVMPRIFPDRVYTDPRYRSLLERMRLV